MALPSRASYIDRMGEKQSAMDDAIGALNQGRVEDALHLWRDHQEREGICDTYLCDHSSYYWTCCASHFQGRLLTLSLTDQEQEYFQLSRKIRAWVDVQIAQQDAGREKGIERLTLPVELNIGHPTIDRDHQNLVKIVNDISVSLESEDYGKCSRLLNDFLELAERHFHKEEEILKAAGFPMLAEHQATHNQLLEKSKYLTKMAAELGESELARERFFTELVSLLFDDAIKLDLVFKSFLTEHGAHA